MLLSHWEIKVLHVVFVTVLGLLAFGLFTSSLLSGRAMRSLPFRRVEFIMKLSRGEALLATILLRKRNYRIGRSLDCDLPLRGVGIAPEVGELLLGNDELRFRSYIDQGILIEGCAIGKGVYDLNPGDTIHCYNYTLKIENLVNFMEGDSGRMRDHG